MKVRKRLQTMVFLVIASSLLTVCVSAPPVQAQDRSSSGIGADAPAWMFDINGAYPDKDYLAVIGEGDSRRAAESDAAGALAKIFQSTISVESTAVMRYQELDTGTAYTSTTERNLEKKVQVGSQQTLFNIQYGDVYNDKLGRVHIVGYLNRKETAKIYREKINKIAERVVGFLKNLRESDSILRKYAFIDAAVLFAKNNEVLLEQLLIIYQPARQLVDLPYSMEELSKLYTGIASQMTFQVSIKNDSDDKIYKMASHILNEKGFTVVQGASNLTINGEVLIEDTKLDNKYENVRWALRLEMRDEKAQILVSFNKNQRESAISRPEAIARSYREMEKQITDQFIGQFVAYLNGIILK